MTHEELYHQYLYEVSLFEKYGSKNVITFDEWKRIKSTMENTQLTTAPELPARTVDESNLKLCRELLGHTTQDIDTLD